MYTNNVCTPVNTNSHHSGRALQSLLRRQIQRITDEGFTRRANQNGITQRLKSIQLVNELQMLRDALAKTNTGVNDDVLWPHPLCQCPRHLLLQLPADIGQ